MNDSASIESASHDCVVHILTTFLGTNVKHIVATNKGIAILVLQLSVYVFLRLLERNIHVTIEAGQDAAIVHAGV